MRKGTGSAYDKWNIPMPLWYLQTPLITSAIEASTLKPPDMNFSHQYVKSDMNFSHQYVKSDMEFHHQDVKSDMDFP
jgi:hypothetical protein